MNAFRPTGSATQHTSGNGPSFDHVAMRGAPIPQYSRTQSASNNSQVPLPALAPRLSNRVGQNGLDGGRGAATYVGAPDYAYTAFDPAQITPPYPPGDQLPGQRPLYDTQYRSTDKSRITPDEYNDGRSLPGHGLNAHFQHTANLQENLNRFNYVNNQEPIDFWSEPGGQNGGTHIPYGTSLQNHVRQFQQSGNQTMPSTVMGDAQYHQPPTDQQRTTTQRSPLEGDGWILVNSENKPRNFSAQSVLQHSMQNGWLVNHDRNSTSNGESQQLQHLNDAMLFFGNSIFSRVSMVRYI